MPFKPIARDLLFTPSIYDSYQWLMKAPPTWKDKAFADFDAALTRKPWEPTAAIKRGMQFEQMVYKVAQTAGPFEASENFTQCVEAVRGAQFQKKLKKIITIQGQSFCLYGKTDASFPKKIVDIKTTGDFKRAKYLGSIQHDLYMYVENVPDFEYVVAVFNKDDEADKEIKRVERVAIHYEPEDMLRLADSIAERVFDFYNFISNDSELHKNYLEKFCLY